MTPTTPAKAKQRVLQFVRAANPQTMEPQAGCRVKWSNLDGWTGERMMESKEHYETFVCHPKIDDHEIIGTDMGLQELLIALNDVQDGNYAITSSGWLYHRDYLLDSFKGAYEMQYDLTKDLHNQSDEFYLDLLPLISND